MKKLFLILFYLFNVTSAFRPALIKGEIKPQIVGGVEAIPFKYTKWLVPLIYKPTNQQFCGATRVSANTVVTAAHCVIGQSASQLEVQGLRHNLYNTSETAIKMPVLQIIIHPNYDSNSEANDIAILKVSDGENLDGWANIDDGRFSMERKPPNNYIIAGWGTTSFGGVPSPILLETNVLHINKTICAINYGNFVNFASMMCAAANGKDTCQGDSGGPLFLFNGTVPVLVGVTSWGADCADPKYPGVYTRVSVFKDWIQNEIDKPTITEPEKILIGYLGDEKGNFILNSLENSYSGIAQAATVFYNGTVIDNGLICGDLFDQADCNVLCRGYGLLLEEALICASFSVNQTISTTLNYYLDDLDCKGYESSISQCSASAPGIHDCLANEGVRITCTKLILSETFTSSIITSTIPSSTQIITSSKTSNSRIKSTFSITISSNIISSTSSNLYQLANITSSPTTPANGEEKLYIDNSIILFTLLLSCTLV